MRQFLALLGLFASTVVGASVVDGNSYVELSDGRQIVLDVALAALNRVIELRVDSAAAAVCLTAHDSQLVGWPSASMELARVLTSPVPIMVGDSCPPTYATMITIVDSLGRSLDPIRPAGYVDPYRLELMAYTGYSPDSARVTVRVRHRMAGEDHRCEVGRLTSIWEARCEPIRRWIH